MQCLAGLHRENFGLHRRMWRPKAQRRQICHPRLHGGNDVLVSFLFISTEWILDRNSLREENLFWLAAWEMQPTMEGKAWWSSQQLEHITGLAVLLQARRQRASADSRTGLYCQVLPTTLWLPVWFSIQKHSITSQIVLPIWLQVFKHMSLLGTFHTKL